MHAQAIHLPRLLLAGLPFAVIVEWGLYSWPVALRLWAWSAGQLLIASAIGGWLYSRASDLRGRDASL